MARAVKARSPIGAALLSLLLPGLGQLYNGTPGRAAMFVAASLIAQVTLKALASATAILSKTTFILMAGIMALAVCLYLFAILDAYAGARRTGTLELHRYNRWYVYLLLIAGSFAVGFATEFSPVHARAYSLPSSSMAPTLLAGDRITVAANAYTSSPPDRGDVIVFERPGGDGNIYMMRLVGLPGDSIQLRDGILRINGVPVNRTPASDDEKPAPTDPANQRQPTIFVETFPDGHSHLIQEVGDSEPYDDTRIYMVPPGHYFAMGDNRDNSTDSRLAMVGFIPREKLRGRVLYIFWARDRSRIGTVVE